MRELALFAYVGATQTGKTTLALRELEASHKVRHGDDGYCVHHEPATHRCQCHDQRPGTCRPSGQRAGSSDEPGTSAGCFCSWHAAQKAAVLNTGW